MKQHLDRDLSELSTFWESGRYVLHHWKEENDLMADCMIYDLKDRLIVRIEDDEIYYALKKRMLDAGVPVIRELPPGQHILEQAIQELMSVGMENEEIGIVHEELKEMYEKGMERKAIEQRLEVLKAKFMEKLAK